MLRRMDYGAIAQLLANVPGTKRTDHPIARMATAEDEVGQRRARRVEQAIVRARQLFPAFADRKERSLVEDRDLNNVAAFLGELRALSDLAHVFGRNVQTPESGSDFLVTVGDRALRVEVVTPSGTTKEREMLLDEWRRENVTVTTRGIAPFGYPEAEKPNDTVQGNAVSRLASLKQKEHQADPTVPSVLWVDLDNDRAFPVSIGISQAQPFTSGNEELVSGAAWWANYGAKGDPIFDRWSFNTGERQTYIMEFDGRFHRSPKYAGVVNVIDSHHIFHQNPSSASPLEALWIVRLLSLPGASFEHWWMDWPVPETLRNRVELARRSARVLHDARHLVEERPETSGDSEPDT